MICFKFGGVFVLFVVVVVVVVFGVFLTNNVEFFSYVTFHFV